MNEYNRLEIDCDELTRRELQQILSPLLGGESEVRFIQRRNLDGDTATWIVLATLASQALPTLLTFLTNWRQQGSVKRIKIGDIEIENPTEKDLEILRERLRDRSVSSDT